MSDSMQSTMRSLLRLGLIPFVLGLGVLILTIAGPAHATPPFAPGDLVVGLGSSPDGSSRGELRHFSPSGALLNTLLTTSGSFEETGPCFDAARNLFTTNFEANSVSKLGTSGALLDPAFAANLNQAPNSCSFDAAGNLYIGLSDKDGNIGGGGLLKLSPAGLVLGSFQPAPDQRGTDWIDLAADQCTLFYTSLGGSIKRFDLCAPGTPGHPIQQLADFCIACDDGDGGATSGPFFALRLLPDGGLLVADFNGFSGNGRVRRYDNAGAQVRDYVATNSYGSICGDTGDQPCFFPWALVLDPDLTSFWTADYITGEVFRFDLTSGAVLSSFQAGICDDFYSACAVTGLAIAGEPTAATTAGGASNTVTAAITAANKVYDTTPTATITSCTLSGVQPADVGNVGCTTSAAAFADANVGTGKPVSASVTLTGSAAGNYTLTSASASTAANITPAPASVTPNAASKTYGAAEPAFTGSMSGFLESVTATYSRTAGESVAGSPYTINATLSPAGVLGNYNVTYNTAAFTITKANASVTPNAASKTYGTADPSFTGTLSGFLAADGVTATYSRTAGESVAGSPYAISATLSPAGALGNYAITYNGAAFTINKANASVTPNAASKTYGASDPAFTGTLTGFLAGDGVTASYSRTAGETVGGSPYAISAILSPAGVLGNYNITSDTASFSITPAVASVTPNAATKTYGAADPTFSGTLSGFLAGDGVTATYSRTAGETVGGSPYAISGALSPAAALSNYAITYNTAAFTITKASASVTPNAATKTFGAGDPPLSGTLSGFVASDGVTALYSRTAGETVAGGPYAITATLSPGSALGNYTITYNTASFVITPTAASVTPNPATKTYGTADPVLTGTLSGFLPSSGVTASYSRTAGENVAGSPYAIGALLSPASALSDYTITYNTAAFTITPATPVVTWADPADISYPTPLSGTQLNASANVPGVFAYSPLAGSVLNVGNGQPLSVLLTPTDNSNYTTAAAQVHINVLPTDVSVAETTPMPVVNVGDTATYNLVVTGNGPGSSTNVVLTDTLPTGLNWTVSGPDAGACSPSSPVAGGNTLTCSFGTLGLGATRHITLTAVTTTTGCGDVVNSATVSATGDSNNTNNSSAPVTITVNCPAIAISKSTSTPSVMAGDTVSYKVVVTAGGTGDSTNVTMTDALPAGLTWTLGGADAGSCALSSGGLVLTCNYGTMAPLEKRTVTLSAATTTANCGTISNTATVTDSLDISPGDNSAGPVAITIACPDVSVSVSAAASIVNAGSNAVYNVVVTANGPGSASSVTLTDVLPAGLSWTVSGTYASSCTTSSGALTCNFGTLAAGASRTITLTAATTTANCGVIKDTATVTAAGDTNSGNNSSGPVSIAVSCPVPPSVTNVILSCPNVSLVGTNLMVSGDLNPASSTLVTILYTSPSGATTSHSTTSLSSGDYTDSLPANEVGKWKVRASASGVSSTECSVIVFGKSQGGTFVIGDVTPGATIHATADFWGSQWWKDNVWSGGVNPGVASLKGYLDAVDLPANCGGSWSTRPGNSSKPPATIPEYMAVVISSTITKNGPTIAGDVVAEVIVKTSPGYGPAPGHDGFGEIVAIRCQK